MVDPSALRRCRGSGEVGDGLVGEVDAVLAAWVVAMAGWPEAGVIVGGVVLVEVAGGVVPGSGWFPFGGSGPDGVEDEAWWLAADLAGAEFPVGFELVIDGGELVLPVGPVHGDLPGLGEASFDGLGVAGEPLDRGRLSVDLVWEVGDGAFGGCDVGLVTAAPERPVVLGERARARCRSAWRASRVAAARRWSSRAHLASRGSCVSAASSWSRRSMSAARSVVEAAEVGGGEGAGPVGELFGELGAAGVGGLVDPGPVHGLGRTRRARCLRR